MEAVRADLLTEPGSGLGGAGKDTDAPYRTVEPVDQSEIDVSRFAVFLLNVGFCLIQEIRVSGSIFLHRLIRLFFDDQQMVVFIENADHISSQCRRAAQTYCSRPGCRVPANPPFL